MALYRTKRSKKLIAVLTAFFLTAYILRDRVVQHMCRPGGSFTSICLSQAETGDWDIFYHLGGNGPWIPKEGLGHVDDPLPAGCAVDQVHMLSRHAERYPTLNVGRRHLALLKRLQNPTTTLSGPLSFVEAWTYFTDGSDPAFENLTSSGRYAGTWQSFRVGRKLRARYDHLVPSDRAVRFWSCESPRDVETAKWFADGFFGPQWSSNGSAELHVIPESVDRGGNTLTPGDTCLKYRTDAYGHDLGYHRLSFWQNVFTKPIATRLADYAPELELSPQDIYSMMEMCGFETLARGYSPWCKVFTHKEWLDFEYARDLLHFYRAGPGNKYAKSMGWLYLNATADLLMNTSSANVYFSFVHDGDIVPMLAALQILDEKSVDQYLPADKVKTDRRWRTSDVVPMGGNVILERVACGNDDKTKRRSVRILINDGLMTLAGVPHSKDVPHGIEVDTFWDFVSSRLDYYGDFREVCGIRDEYPDRVTFLHQ